MQTQKQKDYNVVTESENKQQEILRRAQKLLKSNEAFPADEILLWHKAAFYKMQSPWKATEESEPEPTDFEEVKQVV